MHEAETHIPDNLTHIYANKIAKVTGAEDSCCLSFYCATARQRAEAFLRTLGKWEGGQMSNKCEYCGRRTEMGTFGMTCPHCEPEHDVPALKRRIAKLEAALHRLAGCDWVITLPDRMDGVRKIAREALE
jgi:hypothetical protein